MIHSFVKLAVFRPVKRLSTRNLSRFSGIVFRVFTFSSRFSSHNYGDRCYSLPFLRDQTILFHSSRLDLCSLTEQSVFSFCFVNMSCHSRSSSTYEGWNFNFGNAAVTFVTAHLQNSYFHRPSMYSPTLCRTRSQR